MLRKLLACSVMLLTLAAMPGCIIHDPGYYPNRRAYYSEPVYPYYYGPYLYAPFWFGGYYLFDDSGRGDHFHNRRGFDRRGGGGGRGHR